MEQFFTENLLFNASLLKLLFLLPVSLVFSVSCVRVWESVPEAPGLWFYTALKRQSFFSVSVARTIEAVAAVAAAVEVISMLQTYVRAGLDYAQCVVRHRAL